MTGPTTGPTTGPPAAPPAAPPSGPPTAPTTAPTTGPGTGQGRACGTFGELLQGVLPVEERDFLVTLPIAEFSTARFELTGEHEPVVVTPPTKEKSRRLVERMLAAHGHPGGGRLELTGRLPEGKGLASSSADLVATARAVASALRQPVDATAIETFLRHIEPTDGVMHEGIVAYYHREVRLRERLGCLPALTIVAVDEGGQVDTVRHNRIPKPYSARDRQEYAELLDVLTDAVRTHDLAAVGAVSTRSAELSTKVRPRPLLERLLQIRREADALGLVLAHSGTVIGVLIAGGDPAREDKERFVREECLALSSAVSTHTSLCAATTACLPREVRA
ncbi:kinase [Actinosynnema mirum]|uniref:GHMP kinase n=1 Tax=Actinosynnema mirum (strain ATCC 29888 / DSM 43827 / JCM 3225 / NBRC 14064 / NCIMB 13271 / NRRL B-12336 / IMRU 3971 / 101) TaxID=446462 RepID=C6WLE8_ACTMD|nr:kinase [Actinosynnema mirum]ACU38341.1 GHMP kinase [Actinosynnema mirum DSM 43827]